MQAKNRTAFGICLILSVCAVMVFGQERGRQESRRIRDNISTLMMVRMTQVLGLSEDQAAKIFPKFNEIEKEKRVLGGAIRKAMEDLRQLTRDESEDDAKLSETILTVRELRQQLKMKDFEFEAFLDNHLTPLQRAKYLVFSQEFFRSLQDRLNRAKKIQRERRDLPENTS